MKYVCKNCGRVFDDMPVGMACTCGASLWMQYPHRLSRADINQREFSMWRYAMALPMRYDDSTLTLGEGLTPLVRVPWEGRITYAKNESVQPTGSYKDRGIAIEINWLKSRGVTRIAEDSSGNAGAATAAYAARAGIGCDIYVPESTSAGKVAQMKAFGARVYRVPGPRIEATKAAQSKKDRAFYSGHNWNPSFIEGIKTIAYEIWEQLGFTAPDAVVVPVGNGSLVGGMVLGFGDLMDSGEIERMPRVYGVQATNCDTIVRLFEGKSIDYDETPTMAEGIALYRSSKALETVNMVRTSGGLMVRVAEDDIRAALVKIISLGLFVEPTSAAAFAGLTTLFRSGEIAAHEISVTVITGNGLKATDKILHYLGLQT